MNYIEKIATLFPKDNTATESQSVIYNYNFKNLPVPYSPSFILGVFGLKRNEEYQFHIQVFDDSQKVISDSFTPIIKTDLANFDKSKNLTTELVATTFELQTVPFTVIDNGMYRIQVSLVHNDVEVDNANTYFHTALLN